MTVTIWHNPRCTKSRLTVKLLEENGIEFSIRPYLTDAPTAEEIVAVCEALGQPLISIVRTGEKVFKELGLSKASDDRTLISAMVKNPILIERPIVIASGKAAIGRPPEAVLALF